MHDQLPPTTTRGLFNARHHPAQAQLSTELGTRSLFDLLELVSPYMGTGETSDPPDGASQGLLRICVRRTWRRMSFGLTGLRSSTEIRPWPMKPMSSPPHNGGSTTRRSRRSNSIS